MIRSVGPFDGWLRGAIIACKYHGEWGRVADLGSLLAEVCGTLPPFDALVPVPLHPSRQRHRGFNQSLLLADRVGEILNIAVEENVRRVRRTESQVPLAADERLVNVTGAMAISPGSLVAGRAFVLVDDVITTGSTLAACAAVLLQAGATSVNAATFCREL
jgi:ComF family protein